MIGSVKMLCQFMSHRLETMKINTTNMQVQCQLSHEFLNRILQVVHVDSITPIFRVVVRKILAAKRQATARHRQS